jgi:hypothetical protein
MVTKIKNGRRGEREVEGVYIVVEGPTDITTTVERLRTVL